ncbi:hypothetical protein SSTU70S_03990 [Stutzerimonas stutzeri]
MAIEIKAPTFPESVADGTVATWHKQPGEAVKRDELIVDIETDKVVMEVLAEADGVLVEIVKNEGDTVLSGELLGKLEAGATAAAPAAAAAPAQAPAAAAAPAATTEDAILAPAARKLAEENGIDPNSLRGTGKDGRVTKEDVVAAVEAQEIRSGRCRQARCSGCRRADLRCRGSRREARADDPPACQGRRASGRRPNRRWPC